MNTLLTPIKYYLLISNSGSNLSSKNIDNIALEYCNQLIGLPQVNITHITIVINTCLVIITMFQYNC